MTTTRGLLRVAFRAIFVAPSGFALQAAPMVAVNSADDQVNPPELGILEEEIKRVKRSQPAIWGGELAHLLKESEPKP